VSGDAIDVAVGALRAFGLPIANERILASHGAAVVHPNKHGPPVSTWYTTIPDFAGSSMKMSAKPIASALCLLGLSACNFALDFNARKAVDAERPLRDGGVEASAPDSSAPNPSEGGTIPESPDGGPRDARADSGWDGVRQEPDAGFPDPDAGWPLATESHWKDQDDCAPSNPLTDETLVATGAFSNLTGVEEVHGDLTLRLTSNSPPSLPALKRVFGKLTILELPNAGAPAVFGLPQLEQVGGLTIVGTVHVGAVALPELTRVDCHIRIQANAALRKLGAETWPKLARIDGDVELGTCTDWQAYHGPEEEDAPPSCATNGDLTQLALPALTGVSAIKVGHNPKLATFAAPKLVEASAITFSACGLTEYDGDQAVGCRSFPVLASIDLSALTHTTTLEAKYLTKLRQLTVPLLEAAEVVRLGGVGSTTQPIDLDFSALKLSKSFWLSWGWWYGAGDSGGECRDCKTPPQSGVHALDLGALTSTDDIEVDTPISSLDLHSLTQIANLTIKSAGKLQTLDLSTLAKVSGAVSLAGVNGAPTFPKLTRIGALSIEATQGFPFVCGQTLPLIPLGEYPELTLIGKLTAIDCKEVTNVASLRVRSTPITAIALPALRSATLVALADNAQLDSFSAPLLTDAQIRIFLNPMLSAIDLTSLATCVDLDVTAAPLLTILPLPNLASATLGLRISNTGLQSLRLPKLENAGSPPPAGVFDVPPEIEGLQISDNSKLTEISVPLLTRAATVSISSNPLYPQCEAEALAARLNLSCRCGQNASCEE